MNVSYLCVCLLWALALFGRGNFSSCVIYRSFPSSSLQSFSPLVHTLWSICTQLCFTSSRAMTSLILDLWHSLVSLSLSFTPCWLSDLPSAPIIPQPWSSRATVLLLRQHDSYNINTLQNRAASTEGLRQSAGLNGLRMLSSHRRPEESRTERI